MVHVCRGAKPKLKPLAEYLLLLLLLLIDCLIYFYLLPYMSGVSYGNF